MFTLDRLTNYWYDYQLRLALQQGRKAKAIKILKQLETSGRKLSCLASLYQQQIDNKNSLDRYRQQVNFLNQRLAESNFEDNLLIPQPEFINYIFQCFKLQEIDAGMIQATGIDRPVFTDLEIALVNFLKEELARVPEALRDRELTKAQEDLNGLKKGIDPNYDCRLSSHIYLINYFLENVYCLFLAWFLIYRSGLLPKNLNVLDIAAGVNTSVFSLALLASSLSRFSNTPLARVNYYSLERQAELQYRGLQFWRRYIESFPHPLKTYIRFKTVDLFDYQNYCRQIPQQFFDLIIISHCFFYELEQRHLSHQIYRTIFQQNLSHDGKILLIIQGKKLFNFFNLPFTEDLKIERQIITMFLQPLGLKLEWYKYLSCTGTRTINKSEFYQFAKQNLPPQTYLRDLKQTYLDSSFVPHYAIDDYVILATVS